MTRRRQGQGPVMLRRKGLLVLGSAVVLVIIGGWYIAGAAGLVRMSFE